MNQDLAPAILESLSKIPQGEYKTRIASFHSSTNEILKQDEHNKKH